MFNYNATNFIITPTGGFDALSISQDINFHSKFRLITSNKSNY